MPGEGERNAFAQSRKWDSSDEDGEIAKIADKLERRERLDVARKWKRIVPNFCSSFSELAVRLVKKDGTHNVQTLMDVLFNVLSDAKELRQHVKRVDERKCLATVRTHDALRREKFLEKTLSTAGKGLDSRAALYKKILLCMF